MVNVTELNRGPDISANEIDAASVIADALEVEGASINGALDAEQLSADSLSGDLVSRPEAIDNLEGNVYLKPDGTDPETVLENDGDMVFIHD